MRLVSGIKSALNHRTIRYKINAVYLPLIVIPLLLLGYISNSLYTKAIIDKTIKNVSDNLELIVSGINKILVNTENCANILTLNLNRIVLTGDGQSGGLTSDIQQSREIGNQLALGQVLFPEVESATFIKTGENRIFSSNSKLEAAFSDNEADPVRKALELEKGNRNIWFPMQTRKLLQSDSERAFLPMGKVVTDVSSFDKVGYLILYVREDQLSSLFINIGPTRSGSYFIIDDKGTIISSRNKEDLMKPVSDISVRELLDAGADSTRIDNTRGKSHLIVSKTFERTGWRLVCHIPMDELTEDNRKITMLILLVGSLCLLFALLGSTILSDIISKPIAGLARHMLKSSDGTPDLYKGPETTLEISHLSSAFNTMICRNRGLVARVEEEEKKKREFELALIQLQIKPHFLYNTLDVISALAELGRNSEAIKASKALANFYRAVLNKGREIITIGEEIENVLSYLFIQHIRYSDVFDYEIRIDNDIRSNLILKLTIQPLVENAIYHGLKPKGSPGRILIEGCRESADRIIIKISDDGVGMPEDKVKEFMEKRGAKIQRQSFGIYNVDERIKLFFGAEYGLRLESRQGVGTEARIEIPVKERT